MEYVLRPEGEPVADPASGPVAAPPPSIAREPEPVRQDPPQAPAPARRPAAAQAPQAAPQAPGQPAPHAPPPPAQPSGFPEPWASYLSKVSPDHKMVWTYMELGYDLAGQADARRRTVVADLIKHLRLPPRPVAFWPVAVLQGDRLVTNAEIFWRGWKLWRTPHIVCFGVDALRAILPDADPARTMHMFKEFMVHVMPPLNALADMLPHERQIAVDPLAGLRL